MSPFDHLDPDDLQHESTHVSQLFDLPDETDDHAHDDLDLFNQKNLNRLLFAITCSTRPYIICSAVLQGMDGSEFTYRATDDEVVIDFIDRLGVEAGYRKAVGAFFVLTTKVGLRAFLTEDVSRERYTVVEAEADAPVAMQPGIYWMAELYGVGAIHGVIEMDTSAADPVIGRIGSRRGTAEGMPFRILNMEAPPAV